MGDVATSLAIKVCGNGPVHANLVTLQSRLKTFSDWPSTSGQTPETLADAGFFYIDRFDHVKCFYCDGGLRNWEPADDPWFEHARWFPNCSFVVLNKGDGFVKEVTKSKPPVFPEDVRYRGYNEQSTSPSTNVKANNPVISSSASNESVNSTEEQQNSENEIPTANNSESEKNAGSLSKGCKGRGGGDNLISRFLGGCCTNVSNYCSCFIELEMREELRQLREATQCKICMDNRVEVVFLPCGHLVSCTRCATALSNCAVCRQPIKAYVKTYLS